MTDAPISYSIRDACRATGIGRTKLYELMDKGLLRRVKVGTRTLILRADLIEFLESGKEVQ